MTLSGQRLLLLSDGDKVLKYGVSIGSASTRLHPHPFVEGNCRRGRCLRGICGLTDARASATGGPWSIWSNAPATSPVRSVLPYRDQGAQVIGFPGRYPNDYAQMMMERLCTHPNVGALLLVSLGCESLNGFRLEKVVSGSGRPVKSIVSRQAGGTRSSIVEGLSSIEEKSMGAYAKSGSAPIVGLIKPGDIPPAGGLYPLDIVPDGEVRFGFPNINDNAEIAEMIACGAHVILFVTGRGSVVGSVISPVIKVCANPDTYDRLSEDMDVNAGRILAGARLDDVADEIHDPVCDVSAGAPTRSEALGPRPSAMPNSS